jgi:hypothetical protein
VAEVHVAVARAVDGAARVSLVDVARPTRLHIAVAASIDLSELDLALFESGAAVQLHDADYLISVYWLLQRLAVAGIDSAVARNDLLATARGVDGYVAAVDAIRASVELEES